MKAGYSVTVASPLGGEIPLDPNSINEEILRFMTIRVEELDNEPSVILARREKEEKKAKARAEFNRDEDAKEESEGA